MVKDTEKGGKTPQPRTLSQRGKSASEMTAATSEEDTFLLPGVGQK